jgi:catechol 2,3-dioxygenase-like lactoylglutathione lyase family enzyme
MKRAHFILYVKDQQASTDFYSRVLGSPPSLLAPGMTEFTLPGDSILGLMPEAGIKRLLGEALPDPMKGAGFPRAELYLIVENPGLHHARAIEAGAIELSPPARRGWGHRVAYSLDPDGHVLAFASEHDAEGELP